MKKRNLFNSVIISLMVSFGINLVLFLVNIICAYGFNILPFSYKIPGGDCIEYIGFGVELLEIFTISLAKETVGSTYQVSFEPISIVISFVAIFVIVLLIRVIRDIFRKKAK